MQMAGLEKLGQDAIGLVKPMSSEAAGLKETQKNVDAVAAPAAPKVTSAPPMQAQSTDKINPKARYGMRGGEKRIDTTEMQKPLGSFKDGTDYVPKTGNYKLHEGEAVVPKEKNMESTKDKMIASLSGDKAPKKEIKEMVHSKTHNGKHVVVHKHHHPEHHKDETHMLNDMKELHDHMDAHNTTPDADAAPAGDGAPAQMTAAPSAEAAPMATPGM